MSIEWYRLDIFINKWYSLQKSIAWIVSQFFSKQKHVKLNYWLTLLSKVKEILLFYRYYSQFFIFLGFVRQPAIWPPTKWVGNFASNRHIYQCLVGGCLTWPTWIKFVIRLWPALRQILFGIWEWKSIRHQRHHP